MQKRYNISCNYNAFLLTIAIDQSAVCYNLFNDFEHFDKFVELFTKQSHIIGGDL